MLAKFFFSWFLTWLPVVFSGFVLVVIIFNHFLANRNYLNFLKKLTSTKLIYILIASTLIFDIALSVLQYFVWRDGGFSSFFLPPYQSIFYFLRYSFFHFFAANILALIFTTFFYLILKLVGKYRAGVINGEELSLVFLAGLLASWPNFVILVPLFLALALGFSVINLLAFKKQDAKLILALIIASLVVFIFGNYLISFLSLSVLII